MPDAGPARAAGNLTTLIAHIDHAGGVVGHMRDFLRRGRPHVSTVDLRIMLDDALSLRTLAAAAHGIAIELDAADDLPPIYGDRVQLQQVVLNFVHNAIEAITGSTSAERPDQDRRDTVRRARASRDQHFGQRPRHRQGACGPPVRAADDLKIRRAWVLDFRSAPRSSTRTVGACGSIRDAAGATEFRFSLAPQPSQRAMTMSVPTIFVIDDQESVRHALGEMLNVFGFAVETYESADAFLSGSIDRVPAASWPTSGCRAWTASSSRASSRAARFRSRWCSSPATPMSRWRWRRSRREPRTSSRSRSTTCSSSRRSIAGWRVCSSNRLSRNRSKRWRRNSRG